MIYFYQRRLRPLCLQMHGIYIVAGWRGWVGGGADHRGVCVTATNTLMAAVVVATATAVGVTATTARRGGGPDLMGNIELEYIIGINGVIVIGIH